jgi:hypothetical protein
MRQPKLNSEKVNPPAPITSKSMPHSNQETPSKTSKATPKKSTVSMDTSPRPSVPRLTPPRQAKVSNVEAIKGSPEKKLSDKKLAKAVVSKMLEDTKKISFSDLGIINERISSVLGIDYKMFSAKELQTVARISHFFYG